MARSDLLISLVKAGSAGDKRGFHTAAEAIIAVWGRSSVG
jgi:hypothetical protein